MTRFVLTVMCSYASRLPLIQYASARDIRRMREWQIDRSIGRVC
jgi:hypothetical protein